MPRPQPVPRSHTLPSPVRCRFTSYHMLALLARLLFLIAVTISAAPAQAAAQLWLPTPPGETWQVLQGYGCGSHNSWDRYSLDLVNTNGRTRGAPVRAAADGQIWSWTPKSGTLILAHGGDFYTMYTHMDSAVTMKLNTFVARGTVIGATGIRAANGIAHLHFTAFTGDGPAASHRRSVPLSFAEGYNLPDTGGCNQHGGQTLTAGGQIMPPSVSFSSDAEPQRWYNADKRVEFGFSGATSGFSQAWDRDPGGASPQFTNADAGFMELATAGEGLHTVEVRFWDTTGQPTSASYGPIGYDVTPPQNGAPIAPVTLAAAAHSPLSWNAATDNASGIAGYRIYIGTDPNGSSEWFSPAPQVAAPTLAPGDYVLRIQPLDYAGNAGAWATVGTISVKE